jgi:hypothetical protein
MPAAACGAGPCAHQQGIDGRSLATSSGIAHPQTSALGPLPRSGLAVLTKLQQLVGTIASRCSRAQSQPAGPGQQLVRGVRVDRSPPAITRLWRDSMLPAPVKDGCQRAEGLRSARGRQPKLRGGAKSGRIMHWRVQQRTYEEPCISPPAGVSRGAMNSIRLSGRVWLACLLPLLLRFQGYGLRSRNWTPQEICCRTPSHLIAFRRILSRFRRTSLRTDARPSFLAMA